MKNAPRCLIVDQDAQHAAQLAELCEAHGFVTRLAWPGGAVDGAALAAMLESNSFDIAFLDTVLGQDRLRELASTALADAELFAMADEDDSQLSDACIRAGFSHYFCKPYSEGSLSALLTDIAEELSVTDVDTTGGVTESLDQFGLMRGSSRAMRKLFRLVRKIAPTETTALIVGESGTGKELVAETLHAMSERSDRPYLTLNCSALAENLIESELFGHEKGSFSGAHKRHEGFFERADGGTLFLDEITEMQPDLQAKLLRTLESGEVRRVGAVEPMTVDVRVIAATNRDPNVAVDEGQLREDLYYRLAHITVHVPPLRRRGADIRGLAQYFLMQLNEQHDTAMTLTEAALAKLEQYPWPGNVRQLRHAVERAYIVSETEIADTAFVLGDETDAGPVAEHLISVPLGASLAECERRIITANLEHNDGDKKETAAVLGISLKTLYNRLRDYEADDEAAGRR